MKIDYVIPYVNGSDKDWINLYKQHAINNKLVTENIIRYSPNIMFKFVFRGITKYMPWINNIHLIVQSYTQIPHWINTNTINIIKHSDFIPSQFLPTFNSATIECFLHRIKSLSNFFIYGNDDTYIMNTCYESDFFKNGMPLNVLTEHDCSKLSKLEFYQQFFLNVTHMALKEFNIKLKNDKTYLSTYHVQNAFAKNILSYIFNNNVDDINNSISQFREITNINQYYFIIKYMYKTNHIYNNKNISHANITLSQPSAFNKITNMFNNKIFPKLMCLNDNDNNKDLFLYKLLNDHFPNKSKYEI